MPGKTEDWQVIGRLGSGGQSDVSLVRNATRRTERDVSLQGIQRFRGAASGNADPADLAESVKKYIRPDEISELGAMKVFRLRGNEEQSRNRLQQEINILQQNRPGLPKLLDFNAAERWIVTEYFPEGTLETNYSRYRANPVLALRAFLSLVDTVSGLHKEGIVHRDIKPANVFIREIDKLVLGDFGIVFLPDQPNRLTLTNESVGPHDYMPPWADADGRLENVQPNFDVYMLGKLLWCMVSGRLRLNREWFRNPENNVTVLFAKNDDPHLFIINEILEKSVVENPRDCFSSASDLFIMVNHFVHSLSRGGQLLRDGVPRICRICGYGHYHPEQVRPSNTVAALRFWPVGSFGPSDATIYNVRPFCCDKCGHIQFFKA